MGNHCFKTKKIPETQKKTTSEIMRFMLQSWNAHQYQGILPDVDSMDAFLPTHIIERFHEIEIDAVLEEVELEGAKVVKYTLRDQIRKVCEH